MWMVLFLWTISDHYLEMKQRIIYAIKMLRLFIHVMPDKELAKIVCRARIPIRVATVRRPYHLLYANKLIWASRKDKKGQHEVQMNIRMLSPFKIPYKLKMSELNEFARLSPKELGCPEIVNLLDHEKFNLIIHPGSLGHGKEWPLNSYHQLISKLDKSKFKVFVSGTGNERRRFASTLIEPFSDVIDLTNKLSLGEFASFIGQADGLLSGSTGPLHLSAAIGQRTLGLFPKQIDLGPNRWGPIGEKAEVLLSDKICQYCRSHNKDEADYDETLCECMSFIEVNDVRAKLETWKSDVRIIE